MGAQGAETTDMVAVWVGDEGVEIGRNAAAELPCQGGGIGAGIDQDRVFVAVDEPGVDEAAIEGEGEPAEAGGKRGIGGIGGDGCECLGVETQDGSDAAGGVGGEAAAAEGEDVGGRDAGLFGGFRGSEVEALQRLAQDPGEIVFEGHGEKLRSWGRGEEHGRGQASSQASWMARSMEVGSALLLPAMAKAVPWSGLVRGTGRPRVVFTPTSKSSSLSGISALVVVHREHGVEVRRVRHRGRRVGDVGAAEVGGTGLVEALDGRGDDAGFLVAEGAAFTGVGVEAGDGDTGAGNATAAEEVREQAAAAFDPGSGQQFGHVAERDVDGDGDDGESVAGQAHGEVVGTEAGGEELGLTGEVEAELLQRVLGDRRGDDGVGVGRCGIRRRRIRGHRGRLGPSGHRVGRACRRRGRRGW